MDGDSGDERNDELKCLRSDKRKKRSQSVGRRSSLGSARWRWRWYWPFWGQDMVEYSEVDGWSSSRI